MNELRWILLAAGLALIAGIYAWGLRARGRNPRTTEAETRPAVFTGGASGFERAEPAVESDGAASREGRLGVPAASGRTEPILSLDDHDEDDAGLPDEVAIDFDVGIATVPPVGSRREPTYTMREETIDQHRPEPTLRPRALPPVVEPESPVAPVVRAAPATATATAPVASKPQRTPQKIFALRLTATPPEKFDGAALLEALRSEALTHGRYEIFHRLHADGRPVFSVASLKEPGRFDPATMPETQFPGVALFAVLPGPVDGAEAFDEMLFTARALATHLVGTLGDERGVPLTAARVAALREEVLAFARTLGSA